MRNYICFTWFIASFVVVESTIAASRESDFHSKVVETYSFQPHKLSDSELQTKSKQLDAFWSSVKTDLVHNLPLLRAELANPANPIFFFYDGSKLLFSLSKDKADQALVLRSILKADLRDIQSSDYLNTVHWFASNGFDTRETAFRILAIPDFTAIVPQHALTLGQDFSLIYMLFPMDDTIYVTDLANRLAAETRPKSQNSLLLALWYTATPPGRAAIKKFSEDHAKSAEGRKYALELLARKPPVLSWLTLSSENSLREERRKVMSRPISDEALYEFDALTAKIMAKQ
jgi:hypothetical protein